jgi:hypothetical protein
MRNFYVLFSAGDLRHTQSILHITTRRPMWTRLKLNRSHADSCIGVRHKLGMKFSNAKDEAWPQYKHLRGCGEFANAIQHLSSHGS